MGTYDTIGGTPASPPYEPEPCEVCPYKSECGTETDYEGESCKWADEGYMTKEEMEALDDAADAASY